MAFLWRYSETLLQPLEIFAIQTIIFLQAITLFIIYSTKYGVSMALLRNIAPTP